MYAVPAMSTYVELCLSGEAYRVLHVDDDHSLVEIAATVARDLALHGYLSESAMTIAPIWSFKVSSSEDGVSFSLDFVRDTISSIGLESIWRGARFSPTNIIDGWYPRIEELGHTDDRVELDQREYFCARGDDTCASHPWPSDTPNVTRWETIRDMLAIRTDISE